MSQIPDSKPFPANPENGQDFGWLDEKMLVRFKKGNQDLFYVYLSDQAKAAIQAHFTAQQKEAYDKGFSIGSIEQSKFDQYVPKQHQADLLRARIEALQELWDNTPVDAEHIGTVRDISALMIFKSEAELDRLKGEGV